MVDGKQYIGIDNGVSGTIGVTGAPYFILTPTVEEFNYASSKGSKLHRIDIIKLRSFLEACISVAPSKVILERPMVNPTMFQATCSALRAFEATLILVKDLLALPFEVIDSRKWQRYFFPEVKGSANLKKASKQKGIELFPSFTKAITAHGDADGILIAEWARRNNL